MRVSRQLYHLLCCSILIAYPIQHPSLINDNNNRPWLRLGAIATILSLALDPFAQQLVQTEPRLANTTIWTPTIARTDRYAKGTDIGPSGSNPPFADTDLSMKIAILYGISHTSAEVLSQSSHNCATGNCTWDPFESLAVCSSCNDLQGHLTRYSNFTTLMSILDIDQTLGISIDGTTFRTDNNLIINNADNLTFIPPIWKAPEHAGTIFMTTYGTGNASATASFKDNDLLIWSTSILRLRKKAGLEWPDLAMIEAAECALYYCVKQYNASVYNGVFHENETIVENVRRSPDSWQLQHTNYFGGPDYRKFENDDEVRSLEYLNRTAGLYWSDLMLETDSGSKYNVSSQGVHGISAYFQNTFREEVNTNKSDVGGILNGWALFFGSAQYSPAIMQNLWESPNFSATFNVLARSMSNAIQASDYSPDDTNSSSIQAGVAQVVVIYYSIEWGWIALHAALVLAGIVFLAITIWKTISLGIPAWKSHSLPPLAFPDQVGNLLSDVGSVDVMEQRAARHYVRFVASGTDAMRLTEVTGLVQRPPQRPSQ